jgi:hypothetical protein
MLSCPRRIPARRCIYAKLLEGGIICRAPLLGIGIPAAIGAGKLMTQQLFSVRPWDPVMLASATLALGLAALPASALPAWRAAGVEPMVAPRNE